MKRKCAYCSKPLRGRADKKYCNIHCKNRYAARVRHLNLPIRQRIDRFLHRNHTILYELHKDQEYATKWFVSKAKLQRLGFRFTNMTSYRTNSKGKLYHYIYDYRWMDFSDTMIMIVYNGSRSTISR